MTIDFNKNNIIVNEREQIDEEHVFEFFDDGMEKNFDNNAVVTQDRYESVDFETDLNEEQLEIVNNLKGPMLVIAGAGSGKTRTIVYSVAKLLLNGIKPSEIMLVTFTNKAASEMIRRVESLLGKRPKGIWAGTFHSIANRFLRIYSETAGLKPNYTIMDDSDSKALMKISIAASNVRELKERFPTASMAKDILSYSINCNKSIKEVISWKYSQFEGEIIEKKLKEVYRTYVQKKLEDGLLDFDDLLVFWNRLLDEKFVARLVAKKIKHVLVDEYQDTNYIQDEIIRKIVSQNLDHNVVVVGDDAQSIYAFRGANFQNILKFQDKYPECKIYKITYNYRSTPAILALANDSIANNKFQFEKKMKAVRQPGVKPYQVSVGTEEDQARFISNQVLKLQQDGIELKDIAVLYRAGHHAMKIELELQAKNIPYEVRSGLAFFERAHVKDLLAHLRVIDNPYDELSWARIFNIVPGIGSTSGAKIFEQISKTPHPAISMINPDFFSITMKGCRIQSIGKDNLMKHVNYFLDYGPEDDPREVVLDLVNLLERHIKSNHNDWENRIEDLKQLGAYAQNYSSIRKLLETLSLNLSTIESKTVRSGDDKREEDPMILSTIHRAKGLEWKVVFIPMLCEDLFPSSRVYDLEDEFEEERRVFYVALTRAKDQLYLISPSVIQSFRGIQPAAPSQFVSELKSKLYKRSRVEFKQNYVQFQPDIDKEISTHFSTGLEVMREKSKEEQLNAKNIDPSSNADKKKESKTILDFANRKE